MKKEKGGGRAVRRGKRNARGSGRPCLLVRDAVVYALAFYTLAALRKPQLAATQCSLAQVRLAKSEAEAYRVAAAARSAAVGSLQK